MTRLQSFLLIVFLFSIAALGGIYLSTLPAFPDETKGKSQMTGPVIPSTIKMSEPKASTTNN